MIKRQPELRRYPERNPLNLVTQKFGAAVPTSDLQLSSPLTLVWLEGDIENAIGSSFADEIHGNDLANVLTGGLGDDYLNGGIGFDVAVLSGFKNQTPSINSQRHSISSLGRMAWTPWLTLKACSFSIRSSLRVPLELLT